MGGYVSGVPAAPLKSSHPGSLPNRWTKAGLFLVNGMSLGKSDEHESSGLLLIHPRWKRQKGKDTSS